jgi:hypothetical protein
VINFVAPYWWHIVDEEYMELGRRSKAVQGKTVQLIATTLFSAMVYIKI